jgi:peptide/nickel transport system substrate-binding protein
MVGPNLRVRALTLVVTAGLVVAACGPGATPSAPSESGPAPSTPAESAGPQAQTGGTLFLLMTTATANADKFTDMDPQRIYIGEDLAFFGATIMRSLTAYKYSTDPNEATSLVPDAATDTGTASDGGKTWTFTVRDDMKWQDGSPVKCEDFAYGVSRTFAQDVITGGPTYAIAYLDIPKDADGNPQYPGPYKATPAQQALFDSAVSCNGNVITFKLAKPIGDFNYTVTLGMSAVPNPKDHPGVDTGEQYTNEPWSDGPYMIDSYTPGKGGSLVLKRNPNWDTSQDSGYRGAYPDQWVVQLGLDPKVTDQRLMQPTGDDQFGLQYGNIQPENLQTIFSDSHTTAPAFAGRAFSDYDPYSRYYWIRTDKVTNVKIRQAMAVALDRDSIRAAGGGEFVGDFGDGLIKPNIGQDYAPTGLWTGLLGQNIPDSGDPDFAKQLIADSGEAAPTLTFDYGKSPVGDQVAAIVQESLGKAGFTINLNPIESGYYAYVLDPAKQHEFGTSGWGPDWPNASTVIPPLLTPDGGFDISRVGENGRDKDWMAAVDAALTDTNRADQASKWQALNKEAVQQAYVIPTFFGLAQVMGGDKVGGLYKWAPYGSWPYAQVWAIQQ